MLLSFLFQSGNHNKQEAVIILKPHLNEMTEQERSIIKIARVKYYSISSFPIMFAIYFGLRNSTNIDILLFKNIKSYSLRLFVSLIICNVVAERYYYYNLKYLIYVINDSLSNSKKESKEYEIKSKRVLN